MFNLWGAKISSALEVKINRRSLNGMGCCGIVSLRGVAYGPS